MNGQSGDVVATHFALAGMQTGSHIDGEWAQRFGTPQEVAAMALAVRREASWRTVTLVSVAAAVLFVIFLLLPWGNATFLMAIVTLFAWIAAVAARLRAPHAEH